MEKLVIYHGGCFDGFTAAWVVVKGFVLDWLDAEIYPGVYGEDPPDVTGKDVLIVDFSYPRETLIEMNNKSARLRVIDHHKTAEADLKGLDFCTFDMERSGAGLVWDKLIDIEGRPWLVDTVEDRDLWRFQLEGTKEAMAYIASKKQDLTVWGEIYRMGKSHAVKSGEAILEYIHTYNVNAIEHSHEKLIEGYWAAVVNVPYSSASDCADMLLKLYPNAAFTAGYFQRADGMWQFSLRSEDNRKDVSDIAKLFGGGGHRNAAGFSVEKLPW